MSIIKNLAKMAALGVAERLGHAVVAKSEAKTEIRRLDAQRKIIQAETSKIIALKELKKLYDNNVLSKKEYEKEKKKLLKK